MQERTEVFTEQIQGWYLNVLRYLKSVFSNSVSMLITTLGLLGHSNRYRATVAVARNTNLYEPELPEPAGTLQLPRTSL
jgi:hypothetical protein